MAVTVLCLATADAWQAHEALQAAQARQQLAARPAATPGVPVADVERQRAARDALALLQRPWARVFASVDAVQVEGMAWLALDAGDQGQLRLEGEAGSAAAALTAAEILRRDAQWRHVLVARLDAATEPTSVRFSLVAQPAEGAW